MSPTVLPSSRTRMTNLGNRPLKRVMAAMGFAHPEEIPGGKRCQVFHDGYDVERYQFDQVDVATGPVSILRQELTNPHQIDVTIFDFIYDDDGTLIAIYPVLPDSDRAKIEAMKGKERERELTNAFLNLGLSYFYLSPYKYEVPPQSDTGSWQRIMVGLNQIDAKMKAFVAQNYWGFMRPVGPSNGEEFWFFGVDRSINCFFQQELGHSTDLRSRCFHDKNLEGIIVPVFPTVYCESDSFDSDFQYMNQIVNRLMIRPDDEVLLVGPGCGRDAWAVSRKTRKPIWTIGIDSFEDENTKQTAEIAGFQVCSVHGDNIISVDGQPTIKGRRFDWVIWNMPGYSVQEKNAFLPYRFAAHHDGDNRGAVLRRFARGLKAVLNPGGKSFIWNTPSNYVTRPRGIDVVMGVIAKAGNDAPNARQEFDVRETSYENGSSTYLIEPLS